MAAKARRAITAIVKQFTPVPKAQGILANSSKFVKLHSKNQCLMDSMQLQFISEHLGKYPVVFAYLFGSQAIGRQTPLSDMDIAVFLEKTASRSERFDIRLRLSNELSAVLKTRADLIVMNDIPVQLAYEIIKHGKALFCRDRDARVDTETEILSRYLDRRYYDKRRTECVLNQIRARGLEAV